MTIPHYYELFNPTLVALQGLGSSSSIPELVDHVARDLQLTDRELAQLTPNGKRPLFEYRMAWARSYLKSFGLLQNSERGVWSLTPRGLETGSVDPSEVKRFVRSKRKLSPDAEVSDADEGDASDDGLDDWRDELLDLLLSATPDQFERLCQRILCQRRSNSEHKSPVEF